MKEDMTIDDIKNLVSADESRTLELKKTTGELKDGMHSAYAFPSDRIEIANPGYIPSSNIPPINS